MNRTDRLYAIVEELRAAGPRGRTAARLARHFEVSTRTVKRDVSALQQAGVPIWAESGPGGGYVLDAGATLPPVTFTAGEAAAVAAALAAQPDLPFGPDARSALTKVVGAMTPQGRDAASMLAERIWVRPTPVPPTAPAVARVLQQAVLEGRVVLIDYTDGDGVRTEKRPVEPLAFALHGQWHLLAWCRLRRDGRWFRLDRIAGAWPTTDPVGTHDVATMFGAPPPDAAPVALARRGETGR